MLVLTALMLPLIIGCSSGKNNPIDAGQNVSAEPGDTLYQGYVDKRSSTSNHVEERGYKSTYLEMIGPAEVVEYEYDIKVTNLQLPVFQAQLYNFNSPLDVSMFSCIVDYTDVKPILNEYESIVEFSPLEPLHDGRHEAWISFSGGTSFVYTGISLLIIQSPTKVILEEKGLKNKKYIFITIIMVSEV